MLLHENYRNHGISSDFEDNVTTARPTLGGVYAQLESYGDAISCLSSIIENSNAPSDDETEPSPSSEAMRRHIERLIAHFQQQQRDEKTELSLAEKACHP